MYHVHVCMCSVVPDSVTSWTVPCQAPLSVEFSKQEYWSGLPFPTSEDLPRASMVAQMVKNPPAMQETPV